MHQIKKLASCICFMLILGILSGAVSSLMEMKESRERYAEFWRDPTGYDVWFMGTSHIYYAIQPMELWEQYGIRSYNLAAPSSTIPQLYWTLMCALEYGQPKVVVMDTYKAHVDKKRQDQDKLIHIAFDSIPLSAAKIRGICDMFDTWEDRFEYFCPFSVYHNRWEELSEADFHIQPYATKNALFKSKTVDNSAFRRIARDDMAGTDNTAFRYLEKIIRECQKRGIQLILTDIPSCLADNMQRSVNAVQKVAQEHSLVYLDMAYDEGLLDYSMDFADKAHVNLFGSEKLTKYVGDYLSKHCGLPDGRESQAIAEKWDADYQDYLQYRLKRMRNAQSLKSYLQWLSDSRYSCRIYQEEEPKGVLAKELAQLDNLTYISREEAEARIGGEINGDTALFVEDKNDVLLDQAVFQKGKRQEEDTVQK